ncbi:hypothetical protein ACSBPU_06725 [Parapusillimonas sp. JC17]|uniref:hypothetical protein n=1 Tax=Parapusillimonas sp. JC17 TaxID=3445768 RepID=UPI003FA18AF2
MAGQANIAIKLPENNLYWTTSREFRVSEIAPIISVYAGCGDYSRPTYYSQLRSGRRNLSRGADDFTRACARYLGVPRLTVLALADIVSPEDMYEAQDAITAHLPRAFEYVCTDPDWAHLTTGSVPESSPATQYLIVRLYEAALAVRLLPERVEPQKLAESMITLQLLRAP